MEVARVDETFATTVLIEVIASKFVFVSTETAPITVFTEVIASKFVFVSADTAPITVFAEVIAATFVAMSALFTEVKTETAAILVLLFPILVANAADTVASSALVA